MAEQTFRDYCGTQVERLGGAFPDFRFYKPGAVEELVNWLEFKASGSKQRAAAVITEATDFATIPSIADLNGIWARLFPPPVPVTNPDCPRCNGTGWEVIKRGGAEGTIRCPTGCPVPAWDPARQFTPPGNAEERGRLKRENSQFAAELAKDLAGFLVPRVPAAMPVDIEGIKRIQESRRVQKAREELAS